MQHALGRAADQPVLDAAAREHAHDDHVRFPALGHTVEYGVRRSENDLPSGRGHVGVAQHARERLAVPSCHFVVARRGGEVPQEGGMGIGDLKMAKAESAVMLDSATAGYAGPWNRQSGEVQEKYIITDMFARAARGEDPAAVAAWAQQELENVYGA